MYLILMTMPSYTSYSSIYVFIHLNIKMSDLGAKNKYFGLVISIQADVCKMNDAQVDLNRKNNILITHTLTLLFVCIDA